jgi:transposase
MTVMLDNARDQRCALVYAVAQEVDMEFLYLPTYSPHLNLIERLWKFVKKPCLYAKDYPDREAFQHAIKTCIEQAPTLHQAELKTLVT